MKKGFLFLLLCGSIFYVEASTRTRSDDKKRAARRAAIESWNSVYDHYTGNLEDRVGPRINLPETDISKEDPDYKSGSYTVDDRHEVEDTHHKDEYLRGARKGSGAYYQALSFDEMIEENAHYIGALIGLEQSEFLKQADINFPFFRAINWKERVLIFEGLTPREQVEQYKELLALGKSFKKFQKVVDFSRPAQHFMEYTKLRKLFAEEAKFIQILLGIYRSMVTDELIHDVQETVYRERMAE